MISTKASLIGLAAVLSIALTGCAGGGNQVVAPTQSPTPSATPSPTPQLQSLHSLPKKFGTTSIRFLTQAAKRRIEGSSKKKSPVPT